MGLDEAERIYEKFKELERKTDLEKLKWALKLGDVERAKAISKKYHEEKIARQELTEIQKIVDELENQE